MIKTLKSLGSTKVFYASEHLNFYYSPHLPILTACILSSPILLHVSAHYTWYVLKIPSPMLLNFCLELETFRALMLLGTMKE